VTQHEEYAAIGKAVADLKAAKQTLQAQLIEADNLGQQFEKMGKSLQQFPHHVGLNGESSMDHNMIPLDTRMTFDRKIFNADKFRDLTHEIRETMKTIKNLENKLAGVIA
jgi:predicted  nucleic acid-binding Zn-ribbon protein